MWNVENTIILHKYQYYWLDKVKLLMGLYQEL